MTGGNFNSIALERNGQGLVALFNDEISTDWSQLGGCQRDRYRSRLAAYKIDVWSNTERLVGFQTGRKARSARIGDFKFFGKWCRQPDIVKIQFNWLDLQVALNAHQWSRTTRCQKEPKQHSEIEESEHFSHQAPAQLAHAAEDYSRKTVNS